MRKRSCRRLSSPVKPRDAELVCCCVQELKKRWKETTPSIKEFYKAMAAQSESKSQRAGAPEPSPERVEKRSRHSARSDPPRVSTKHSSKRPSSAKSTIGAVSTNAKLLATSTSPEQRDTRKPSRTAFNSVDRCRQGGLRDALLLPPQRLCPPHRRMLLLLLLGNTSTTRTGP